MGEIMLHMGDKGYNLQMQFHSLSLFMGWRKSAPYFTLFLIYFCCIKSWPSIQIKVQILTIHFEKMAFLWIDVSKETIW